MRRAQQLVAGALLVALGGCAVALSPDPWPIGNAMLRPDTMFVEPRLAQPGAIVAVTYADPWDRGTLYAIDTEVGGEWERRYLLVSDASGGRPTWFSVEDEGIAVEPVGIGGPGPDRVPIPDDIEPGDYRLCTANAGEDICTQLRIGG